MATPFLPQQEHNDGGDFQTAEELAAYLKVDPKTVFNWAKEGIIRRLYGSAGSFVFRSTTSNRVSI